MKTDIFVVTAYRWGLRDDHSYVVGAFQTATAAKRAAKAQAAHRGGKYSMEIVRCGGRPRNGDNVDTEWRALHLPCPQEGAAGRSRRACQLADTRRWVASLGVATPTPFWKKGGAK